MAGWNELDRFRKVLVLILALSTVVSIAAFALFARQKGVIHEGAFLLMETEGENTIYSGKVGGEPVRFTVTPKREVAYRKGEGTVVTYTVAEDPTAVPEDGFPPYGVEVRQGESVVFRGAYADMNGGLWLVDEADGGNWFGVGSNPDIPPLVGTAVELACAPELVYRGEITMLGYGLLMAALGAIAIFFADTLFRLDLAFRIRNADRAEPSEWELFSRAAGQVLLTVVAVGCYLAVWLV